MPIVHARTAEAIEEERRLLYVAVTRARVRLALSWAPARTPGAEASAAAVALPGGAVPVGGGRGGALMSDSLDKLLDLLDLEQIEVNIFRGRSPDETVQRVYGGQVAGQALVAAGRTVPDDRPVHSLHAYFIRPGDPSVPLIYSVDRIRDGRSFTTRRVTAIQHGKPIFALSASFHHPEPGLEYALPMPAAPPPEQLRPNAERFAEAIGVTAARARPGEPDRRPLGRPDVDRGGRRPVAAAASADNLVWLRVNGRAARRPAAARLPDDLRLGSHAARHGAPRPGRELAQRDRLGGEPGPRDVVPPAVPRRPVAAVRPGVDIGLRARAAWPAARCSPPTAIWSSPSSRKASSAPLQSPITKRSRRPISSGKQISLQKRNPRSKMCCPAVKPLVELRHVRGPEQRPLWKEVPRC